jgi:uncharacterized protein
MIIRLLIWLIIGFLIYTVFQAVKQALLKPPTPPPEKSRRGEDMVQDPCCGTYVPRNDAVTETINGERHYFCSEECRVQFQKEQSSDQGV